VIKKQYFVKCHSDSMHKYSEVEIRKMLEFLIDDIFVVVYGQIFLQSVGIPMGANCASSLADLSLYSYEAEFIQNRLHEKKKISCCGFQFNISICYGCSIYQQQSIPHICPFDISQMSWNSKTPQSALHLFGI
jgi:hypothetical protein